MKKKKKKKKSATTFCLPFCSLPLLFSPVGDKSVIANA